MLDASPRGCGLHPIELSLVSGIAGMDDPSLDHIKGLLEHIDRIQRQNQCIENLINRKRAASGMDVRPSDPSDDAIRAKVENLHRQFAALQALFDRRAAAVDDAKGIPGRNDSSEGLGSS
jgi:hypothetical protein